VRFGYRALDQLIGRFLDDYGDDRLVFATALSQEPWDTDKCTYRPRDFDAFLALCDLPASRFRVEPVMAEQFYVVPHDAADVNEAIRKIEALQVGDRPLMEVQTETDRVFTGCALGTTGDIEGTITTSDGSLVSVADQFHMIHSVRSGRHIPQGMLWVRTGTHQRHEDPRSLTDLAPSVLQWLDVDVPDYMKGEPLPVT
jgi:hypothetical protein